MKNNAQGTIEYLVIMAIVIVIGLIVVGMMSTFFNSSSDITNKNNKLNNIIGSGGISILESVSSESGRGTLIFKNTSGETLTIQKIATENREFTYNKQITNGSNGTFTLNDLNIDCPCIENKTTTCTYTITFQSASGITKTTTQTTTNECLDNDYTTNGNPETPLLCPSYAGLQEKDGNLIICDCTDLQNISLNLNANYLIGDNINCYETRTWNSNAGFAPIGNFSGTFNGNNKTISNLNINRSGSNNIGLFSSVSGNILNTQLVDANIIGNFQVGSLVASLSGTITNSYSTGTVLGFSSSIGGLIGTASNSATINNSYSTSDVNGYRWLGGLVGLASGSTITNSYATGNVFGTSSDSSNIGGLTGNSWGNISYSYATGDINNKGNTTGGLIGYQQGGTVSYSYATGIIKGKSVVGGLVGSTQGNIKNSFATGDVTGTDYVGGLIGSSSTGKTCSYCYATGNVTGNTLVGGLIGSLTGDFIDGTTGIISYSYATGNVIGTDSVGGLTGQLGQGSIHPGRIDYSYFTGNISGGGTYVNGLIGELQQGSVNNSYWDTVLSGKNYCYFDSENFANYGVGYLNDGCTQTNDGPDSYYGLSGIPFDVAKLNWDGNWTAQNTNYPILTWQN